MATLTIRNVPPSVVETLKARAKWNNRSMEQEVREILEESARSREDVLRAIEAFWSRQSRRPTAEEIDAWIEEGRD